MLYFRLAWRNLWRNRRRTFITVAAVFFAGFAVIAMRSLQLGTYDSMIRTTVGSSVGFLQIHKNGYWDERTIDNSFEFSEDLYKPLNEIPDIAGVSPRLSGFSLISNGLKTRGIQVEGIDPAREAQLDLEDHLIRGAAVPGDGIIVGEGLADFLKIEIGDSVVLIGQGYHGMSANALVPVTGVVKFINPLLNNNAAVMDLNNAQYTFAAFNRLSALAINTVPDADLMKVQAEIQNVLGQDSTYEVLTWQEMMPELVQSIEADSAGGILMAGILYIVVGFSLLGTFIMLAAERRREYGMLIGLGMRRGQLMFVAFIEASFMAVLGALFAVVFTRPLTAWYHYNPIQMTGQAKEALIEMGMDAEMPASIDWSIPFTHGLILLVLTMIISSYAVLAIKRIKPVQAMRS